jgi:hypothetical protein
MVRAILDGSKTQTRRIVKNMPASVENGYFDRYGDDNAWNWWTADHRPALPQIACPYGKPGDRLWVRESMYSSRSGWRYDADQQVVDPGLSHINEFVAWNASQKRNRIPSIHIPRWASRITLEVESVRVERLQDISEADARAEGIWQPNWPLAWRTLWKSINGPGSWDANPWVWVVTFKRIQP